MSNEPILIAGAAGGVQGSTGNIVARALLAQGIPVRAFVRQEDERAAKLHAHGAEIHVGDLREIKDVEPALRGVKRAFFTYPVADGLLDATAVFASAAASQGVQQVVEVSQLGPEPHAPTPRLRQHWVSEQVFDHAQVGAIHLRATAFYENIRALIRPGENGFQLVMPLGDDSTVLPLVSGGDVAKVATDLLARKEIQPAGFHRIVGEFVSVKRIAEAFERAVGQPLHYVDVPGEAWHQVMVDNGLNAHAAAHLTSLWQLFRDAGAANWPGPSYENVDSIERIIGQKPQTIDEFFQANVAQFGGQR